MDIIITTSTDNNSNSNSSNNSGNSGDSTSMILRILEVGLIFEYLHTMMIIRLLTSSRVLINFRGIIFTILSSLSLPSTSSSLSSSSSSSSSSSLPLQEFRQIFLIV